MNSKRSVMEICPCGCFLREFTDRVKKTCFIDDSSWHKEYGETVGDYSAWGCGVWGVCCEWAGWQSVVVGGPGIKHKLFCLDKFFSSES